MKRIARAIRHLPDCEGSSGILLGLRLKFYRRLHNPRTDVIPDETEAAFAVAVFEAALAAAHPELW
jgi:hypothetical protein